MVIGLDIDGTITRHPKFFAFLTRTMLLAGHEVIVITFREDRDSAASDLSDWGIQYSRLVTWTPAARASVEMLQWKGDVCREFGVELFFDDDPQVLRRTDPEVVSLMVVDHEEYDLARLTP